eukprot:113002_1
MARKHNRSRIQFIVLICVQIISILSFVYLYDAAQQLVHDHDTLQSKLKPQHLTIVSGASANHWNGLVQMVNRFELLYSNVAYVDLVVYDLGLTGDQFDKLQTHCIAMNHTLVQFNDSQYPSHVSVHYRRKTYAWKTILFRQVCKKYGDLVLWLDSGDFMKGKLNAIYNALQTNYIFTTLSPHDIKKWTHPKTLQYFNFTGNISHRNIASGLFGVNYNVFWVKDLVEDWAVCGMHLECISPKGSTRKNHRQDQAALTVLFHQYRNIHKFNTYQHEEEWNISFWHEKGAKYFTYSTRQRL